MWPSVHHRLSSHPSNSPVSASIFHPHSLAASAHLIFCHYPHCCCRCCGFLLPRVNRTDRPAAARRQTDLLLRCIWAGGCGHRYRIRSRSCSLLRNPPLHTPSRERESTSHCIPQTLVQLPDRAGSTLGTEVSLRYSHPDSLTAAAVRGHSSPADSFLSHTLIALTVEAETSRSHPRGLVGWPDCCASDSGGLHGPERVRVREKVRKRGETAPSSLDFPLARLITSLGSVGGGASAGVVARS